MEVLAVSVPSLDSVGYTTKCSVGWEVASAWSRATRHRTRPVLAPRIHGPGRGPTTGNDVFQTEQWHECRHTLQPVGDAAPTHTPSSRCDHRAGDSPATYLPWCERSSHDPTGAAQHRRRRPAVVWIDEAIVQVVPLESHLHEPQGAFAPVQAYLGSIVVIHIRQGTPHHERRALDAITSRCSRYATRRGALDTWHTPPRRVLRTGEFFRDPPPLGQRVHTPELPPLARR